MNDTELLPVVTSTRPGARAADRPYSAGLIMPSACPAIWSARATIPANSGLASLVPQFTYQPAGSPAKLSYVLTRPEQAALMEMSATPRCPPTTLATEFWYDGRAK